MTWDMRARLFSLILGGAMLLSAAARAEELGNFGAWYAFTQGEGQDKLCYMVAAPIQSVGDIPNRGEVGVMVTHQMGALIVLLAGWQTAQQLALV
jgi:hypothetical protein